MRLLVTATFAKATKKLHAPQKLELEVWAGNVQARCSLPRRLTLKSTTLHSLHLLIETAQSILMASCTKLSVHHHVSPVAPF